MRNVHCRNWNMARKQKNVEMRHKHCLTWNMARNTKKRGNIRNAHCRTWIKVRKLKHVENETQTLYDLEYGEKHQKTWKIRLKLFDIKYGVKHSKTWKMRNAHCRTWSMVRKLKNMENEKCTL